MAMLEGINLNDYEEPTILPDNEEVDFRVIDAEEKTKAETGTKWLQLVLQPFNSSVTNPVPVYHNLFYPKGSDDKQAQNRSLGYIKRFCDAIGYSSPDGGLRTEDIIGTTGRMVVKVNPNEGYGEPRNEVRKFIKQ